MTSAAAGSPAVPPRPSDPVAGQVRYSERLLPSVGVWGGVVVFAVVMGIALSIANAAVAVATGVVVLLVGVAVAWWTSPVVSVVGDELVAGHAHIPLSVLGDVTVLDREGVRTQMGTGWDARAYACLRTWTGSAVRVEVVDPQDPTPFWVVSTRRPDELAAAVTAQG